MPYNLPKYNTSRFSIGPCVVYMGDFCTTGAACTPDTDVGAVNSGAALTTTREKTEIFQGFPKTLVDQFATQETAVLKFESIEWNLSNLSKALGAGTLDVGSDAIGSAATPAALSGSSTGPYTGTITIPSGKALVPGDVIIYDGAAVADGDDGDGALVAETGTVDYETGAVSVTFSAPPTGAVTAGGSLGELVCASGAVDTHIAFLKWPYVLPSSLTLTAQNAGGALVITDDGDGALEGDTGTPGTGENANAIEYETGRVNVTWSSVLALNSVVVAEYTGTEEETLSFGGEISFNEVAIKLVHATPKGMTVTVKIWKAQGSGAVEMTFGDDPHAFPMEFNAMVPFDPCLKLVLDWDGEVLVAGRQLFEIVITKASAACVSQCT